MPVKKTRQKMATKSTSVPACEVSQCYFGNCPKGGGMTVLVAVLLLGVSMMFFALVQMHSQTHNMLYRMDAGNTYDQIAKKMYYMKSDAQMIKSDAAIQTKARINAPTDTPSPITTKVEILNQYACTGSEGYDAKVTVNKKTVGEISTGFLFFLGIAHADGIGGFRSLRKRF